MENASKALIIAGAILLSILIIGLGMTVYNSASSQLGGAKLDAQELQAHNSQFLAYEGKQKGAQVNALVTAIKTNNAQYDDRKIGMNFSATSAPKDIHCFGTAKSSGGDSIAESGLSGSHDTINAKSTTSYYVSFGYAKNGCINCVEIHVYSDEDLNKSTNLGEKET